MAGPLHIFLIVLFVMGTCNIKTRAEGPLNIAKGKPAHQITTYMRTDGNYSYAAGKAVNGNTKSNLEG